MSDNLSPKALRLELGETLDQMAWRIGVKSRGYVSMIERGAPCSVSVALAYERISEGRIPAASMSKDVALIDDARRQHDAGPSLKPALLETGNADEISAHRESVA